MTQTNTEATVSSVKRTRNWFAILGVIVGLFGLRLFYLQVIRYDHYKSAALQSQLKQYEIPAARGAILAHEGDGTVPIVLNQKLYTLYADPTYIKDANKVAGEIASIIGGQASDYTDGLTAKDTRYSVLKKKLSPDQADKIAALKEPGLGSVEQDYRTYPQGSLAAQVLGFVNDSGTGTYGIEQALNDTLKGTPGELKAVTDARGVPLAASKNNIDTSPVNGKNVVLTIDVAMQQQLEAILAQGVQNAKSSSGSAIIMDPKTGAIKAMANYPTYDPANYSQVSDAKVFSNAAVTAPLEVGSVMKPLTAAAALDQGAVKPNQTYNDPAQWLVDGFHITNIEEDGPAGVRSIRDILNLSLNTGATWLLMQMGGGKLDEKGRDAWYDYMTNHYMFGKPTGIEQGNDAEASGYVPSPKDNGAGIDLTYANTTFGQAMTATPIQMAAAYSAMLNGGTYYQPRLVDGYVDAAGKETAKDPIVVKKGIVSNDVANDIIPMMEYTVSTHGFSPKFDQNTYAVGGKTGTAQIAKPGGGYYDNEFNGTYCGFVGGDSPQYVIVVKVDQPHNGGYAGTAAAQPIFGGVAHMLINNFNVTPKSK